MEKTIIRRIETIVFIREEPKAEPGDWEKGLLINEGQVILDKYGKVVPSVWKYEERSALVVETEYFRVGE